MVRSILVFIGVLMIIMFAVSNVHHIPLKFAGEPFNVRLIYLMLFSYLLGVLSAAYFFIMTRINARKKKQKEQVDEEREAF